MAAAAEGGDDRARPDSVPQIESADRTVSGHAKA